jgi:hypothetical protein
MEKVTGFSDEAIKAICSFAAATESISLWQLGAIEVMKAVIVVVGLVYLHPREHTTAIAALVSISSAMVSRIIQST